MADQQQPQQPQLQQLDKRSRVNVFDDGARVRLVIEGFEHGYKDEQSKLVAYKALERTLWELCRQVDETWTTVWDGVCAAQKEETSGVVHIESKNVSPLEVLRNPPKLKING